MYIHWCDKTQHSVRHTENSLTDERIRWNLNYAPVDDTHVVRGNLIINILAFNEWHTCQSLVFHFVNEINIEHLTTFVQQPAG